MYSVTKSHHIVAIKVSVFKTITVKPRYDEALGTGQITSSYPEFRHIWGKNTKKIIDWDHRIISSYPGKRLKWVRDKWVSLY